MSKAKQDGPIKWSLKEIDKKLIRPNASNPKTRNEKGFAQLEKITNKFGVIYDGILNADLSLIDGHSRLEMYPEGKGNYFVPSRQLNDKDEKELNALFDVARAGDPDLFMIEQILDEETLLEWDGTGKKKKGGSGDDKKQGKYPLVPQYDEKYEAIVIMCTNSIDTVFIKNALGVERMMSYKNKAVKETSIVTAKQFIEKWKSR